MDPIDTKTFDIENWFTNSKLNKYQTYIHLNAHMQAFVVDEEKELNAHMQGVVNHECKQGYVNHKCNNHIKIYNDKVIKNKDISNIEINPYLKTLHYELVNVETLEELKEKLKLLLNPFINDEIPIQYFICKPCDKRFLIAHLSKEALIYLFKKFKPDIVNMVTKNNDNPLHQLARVKAKTQNIKQIKTILDVIEENGNENGKEKFMNDLNNYDQTPKDCASGILSIKGMKCNLYYEKIYVGLGNGDLDEINNKLYNLNNNINDDDNTNINDVVNTNNNDDDIEYIIDQYKESDKYGRNILHKLAYLVFNEDVLINFKKKIKKNDVNKYLKEKTELPGEDKVEKKTSNDNNDLLKQLNEKYESLCTKKNVCLPKFEDNEYITKNGFTTYINILFKEILKNNKLTKDKFNPIRDMYETVLEYKQIKIIKNNDNKYFIQNDTSGTDVKTIQKYIISDNDVQTIQKYIKNIFYLALYSMLINGNECVVSQTILNDIEQHIDQIQVFKKGDEVNNTFNENDVKEYTIVNIFDDKYYVIDEKNVIYSSTGYMKKKIIDVTQKLIYDNLAIDITITEREKDYTIQMIKINEPARQKTFFEKYKYEFHGKTCAYIAGLCKNENFFEVFCTDNPEAAVEYKRLGTNDKYKLHKNFDESQGYLQFREIFF